jgi:hypothetical protein
VGHTHSLMGITDSFNRGLCNVANGATLNHPVNYWGVRAIYPPNFGAVRLSKGFLLHLFMVWVWAILKVILYFTSSVFCFSLFFGILSTYGSSLILIIAGEVIFGRLNHRPLYMGLNEALELWIELNRVNSSCALYLFKIRETHYIVVSSKFRNLNNTSSEILIIWGCR